MLSWKSSIFLIIVKIKLNLKKNCQLSTLNALFSFCNRIEKRASDDAMHVSWYKIYLIKTKRTEYYALSCSVWMTIP